MNWFKSIVSSSLGKLCLIIIFITAFMAVFAYLLIPDKTTDANLMHLTIAGKSPGYSCKILRQIEKNANPSIFTIWYNGDPSIINESPVKVISENNGKLKYQEILGANEFGETKEITLDNFAKISKRRFWFGTDKYGRDYLSRVVLGARVSFFVGVVAVLISLIIGVPVGALAGYYGGTIDRLIMWFINIIWSIPTLLLVIAITLALTKGFWQVFIAIGFTMWVEVARVVRGQFMSLKENEYIQAAKALGYSDIRIIYRQMLPNAVFPIVILSAANFAAAILIESGLSFLGIGTQPPTPSWGNLIKEHYSYILLNKAYLAIIPGVCLSLLIMAFLTLGNLLRDALDVKIT